MRPELLQQARQREELRLDNLVQRIKLRLEFIGDVNAQLTVL